MRSAAFKNRFQSSLVPLKLTFMEPFPWRKRLLGKNNQFGLFFIQWMPKIDIPTSSLPLWEHMFRSNRDILFITLESFINSIVSKQRFSSLRKFKLCICKKIDFFGAADVKSKRGMILAGELQFYQQQKRKLRKIQVRTRFEPRPPSRSKCQLLRPYAYLLL